MALRKPIIGGLDIIDATAEPSNVASGKVFYNNNGRQEGIWTPTVTDFIKDATATPDKVLQGEVFYNNEGRQEGIYVPDPAEIITDATALPSDVASGKIFYNNDGRQQGTLTMGLKEYLEFKCGKTVKTIKINSGATVSGSYSARVNRVIEIDLGEIKVEDKGSSYSNYSGMKQLNGVFLGVEVKEISSGDVISYIFPYDLSKYGNNESVYAGGVVYKIRYLYIYPYKTNFRYSRDIEEECECTIYYY